MIPNSALVRYLPFGSCVTTCQLSFLHFVCSSTCSLCRSFIASSISTKREPCHCWKREPNISQISSVSMCVPRVPSATAHSRTTCVPTRITFTHAGRTSQTITTRALFGTPKRSPICQASISTEFYGHVGWRTTDTVKLRSMTRRLAYFNYRLNQ